MLKVMIFIDGSWLCRTRGYLSSRVADSKLVIDYGKLPHVLVGLLGKQMGVSSLDLVRTYFFASLPANVDPRDTQYVEDQQDFYDRLTAEFHYEVELFPIDFKGRRYHKDDRDPEDSFIPKEKCVDVALSTSMLYLATVPSAYDTAITVIGDEDYVPVLQRIRQLGKRVVVVSVHESCADAYDPFKNPTDSRRVRDVDTIFLDEIIPDVLCGGPYRSIKCESDLHEGNPWVLTSERMLSGGPYYCPKCRKAFNHCQPRKEIEQVTIVGNPTKEASLRCAPAIVPV